MIKKAMILAAGFGKRIHPLTLKHPKPLLKIGKETLLSNTLKFLKLFGIKQVVINVHYLGEQIVDYINRNQFNLSINVVKEKDKILDTGGGVLNAIQYFSNEPFLIINPDTIWNSHYLKELKLMEKLFFENKKNKCSLLVVNKEKSFDKSFKGDFNLKNNLISRKDTDDLNCIYTGLQIIKPEVFSDLDADVFSINKIWDMLIETNELHGIESHIDFLHVSTLDIYKNLLEKNLNIK
jgi:MurNAc alpha-1-phosphate uridylyltransferase